MQSEGVGFPQAHTSTDYELIIRFGQCQACGVPRLTKTEIDAGVVIMTLTCRNGHEA